MLKPSTNGSIQQISLQIFRELLHKHPLAFLGGTWASLMLLAYLAAWGLLSPGSMEREKPPETPPSVMVEEPPTDALPQSTTFQASQTPQPESTVVQDLSTSDRGFTKVRASSGEEGMPMWLFGALALTCAGGTLLIYGSLKQSQPRRQPVKRKQTSLKASPTTARSKQQLPSRRQRLKKPISMPQPSRSVADLPVVTVLPPEESHPLDWGEDSLADMMDMRKRQSLASLLRNRR